MLVATSESSLFLEPWRTKRDSNMNCNVQDLSMHSGDRAWVYKLQCRVAIWWLWKCCEMGIIWKDPPMTDPIHNNSYLHCPCLLLPCLNGEGNELRIVFHQILDLGCICVLKFMSILHSKSTNSELYASKKHLHAQVTNPHYITTRKFDDQGNAEL